MTQILEMIPTWENCTKKPSKHWNITVTIMKSSAVILEVLISLVCPVSRIQHTR